MPNWVKVIGSIIVCWLTLRLAGVFLRTGGSDQWN